MTSFPLGNYLIGLREGLARTADWYREAGYLTTAGEETAAAA